jgi:hypothetical protein
LELGYLAWLFQHLILQPPPPPQKKTQENEM